MSGLVAPVFALRTDRQTDRQTDRHRAEYLVPSSKSSASLRPRRVGNMSGLVAPVFALRNSSRLEDSSRQRNVSAFNTDDGLTKQSAINQHSSVQETEC